MIIGKAWALGQTKIERGEDRSEFPSHERLVEKWTCRIKFCL